MPFGLGKWEDIKYEIHEQWKRLDIRERINQSSRSIIVITCFSIFILLVVVWQLRSDGTVKRIGDYKKEWFYDLNTGKLFVAKKGLTPPIEAPSGLLPNEQLAGVKAYVFSYKYEPNESERFIGFLETIDPNAEQNEYKFVKTKVSGDKQWGRGKLIRRVEDEEWFSANSYQGQSILKEVFLPNENGERARYYSPR
jgi:hypothetical protein